jgi:hypothetical protein
MGACNLWILEKVKMEQALCRHRDLRRLPHRKGENVRCPASENMPKQKASAPDIMIDCMLISPDGDGSVRAYVRDVRPVQLVRSK